MLYIEGYLDRYSVAPGETVRVYASTNTAWQNVRIVRDSAETDEIVLPAQKIKVGTHPTPDRAYERGAGWPQCWEFTVPAHWPSDVYRVELSGGDAGLPGFVPDHWASAVVVHPIMLVVRAARPATHSKILLQLSTNTYAAYNWWGGKSLYNYNSSDKQAAQVVSLLRPGHGFWGHTTVRSWETQFYRWCRRRNIPIELATNYDLHTWPRGFDDYKLILSVGHDEYWSAPMRDHLEAFIARGGNAAFFSGNSVCWQVRFENDGQTMVGYKELYKQDPVYHSRDRRTLSTLWSHPLVNRPENRLTGVGFPMGGYHRSHGAYMDGSGAYTVRRAEHWSLEGTGLRDGDAFGGANTIVGYECDGCEYVERGGRPYPTGKDGTPGQFEIVAQAPAVWTGCDLDVFREANVSPDGRATLGAYTLPKGGAVFTAGTTDWAHALGHDPIVERITLNVLRRLGA